MDDLWCLTCEKSLKPDCASAFCSIECQNKDSMTISLNMQQGYSDELSQSTTTGGETEATDEFWEGDDRSLSSFDTEYSVPRFLKRQISEHELPSSSQPLPSSSRHSLEDEPTQSLREETFQSSNLAHVSPSTTFSSSVQSRRSHRTGLSVSSRSNKPTIGISNVLAGGSLSSSPEHAFATASSSFSTSLPSAISKSEDRASSFSISLATAAIIQARKVSSALRRDGTIKPSVSKPRSIVSQLATSKTVPSGTLSTTPTSSCKNLSFTLDTPKGQPVQARSPPKLSNSVSYQSSEEDNEHEEDGEEMRGGILEIFRRRKISQGEGSEIGSFRRRNMYPSRVRSPAIPDSTVNSRILKLPPIVFPSIPQQDNFSEDDEFDEDFEGFGNNSSTRTSLRRLPNSFVKRLPSGQRTPRISEVPWRNSILADTSSEIIAPVPRNLFGLVENLDVGAREEKDYFDGRRSRQHSSDGEDVRRSRSRTRIDSPERTRRGDKARSRHRAPEKYGSLSTGGGRRCSDNEETEEVRGRGRERVRA